MCVYVVCTVCAWTSSLLTKGFPTLHNISNPQKCMSLARKVVLHTWVHLLHLGGPKCTAGASKALIVKAMDIIFVFEVTTVHVHHAVYWVVFAV